MFCGVLFCVKYTNAYLQSHLTLCNAEADGITRGGGMREAQMAGHVFHSFASSIMKQTRS